MTRLALLGAAAAGLGTAFFLQDDPGPLLRSSLELLAVCGVFTLVCAAEATN